MFSGHYDNVIRIWKVPFLENVFNLKAATAPITCLCIDPEGEMLLAGSADFCVRFWNLENIRKGGNISQLEGHEDIISDMEFSPQGNKLVTVGFDFKVYKIIYFQN